MAGLGVEPMLWPLPEEELEVVQLPSAKAATTRAAGVRQGWVFMEVLSFSGPIRLRDDRAVGGGPSGGVLGGR